MKFFEFAKRPRTKLHEMRLAACLGIMNTQIHG